MALILSNAGGGKQNEFTFGSFNISGGNTTIPAARVFTKDELEGFSTLKFEFTDGSSIGIQNECFKYAVDAKLFSSATAAGTSALAGNLSIPAVTEYLTVFVQGINTSATGAYLGCKVTLS